MKAGFFIEEIMNQHSQKTLEYDKVLIIIKGKCLTPYGAEQADLLEPLYVRKAIEQRLTEITQMRDIIKFGIAFPLYRLEESRDCISRSMVEEHFLEPADILQISHLIKASHDLHRYDKENWDKFPLIAEYLKQLRSFPELITEIERAIDPDGSIKDSASKTLRTIRQNLADSRHKIENLLNKILASQKKQAGWQDDVVTLRSDRYVIGVPTNRYQHDMGILHDRSQTGATLFIEPKEAVEMNNKIHLLHQQEYQEIVRILKALTAEIRTRADSLLENCRLIGQLDLLHACGNFSAEINGNQPKIVDDPSFKLIDARHPLLVKQFKSVEKVIPNTISLNDDCQAILVTGPNTGGKTICLKTVGLSILMAQTGLHISVDEKSEVGIFHDIFADIGDEQSIELSLSTFSSHITNIIDSLKAANGNVLLLYDEIGAGTDPKEGSALAESIILHALEKGARMIVTTHYSQLKTLAMEYSQLENASLEFDKKTLAPTYELRIGIPGSSYAVEIAGRLGMPQSICTRAVSLLDSGEKSLDKLITSLEEELKAIKEDKTELSAKLEKATELEAFYKTRVDALTKEVETEKKKALEETETFLASTRKEIEHLVAEIRSSDASDKAVKAFHHKLREREAGVAKRKTKPKPKNVDYTNFAKGDAVEIISLGQKGEIDELIGNNKAKVKVGSMYTTVEIRNLIKIDKPHTLKKTVKAHLKDNDGYGANREIHLRGMTVEEAILELEKFLDRAVISGLTQVYVIHGKGSGILRKQLTEYLKKHREVASVRLGDFNEGGAGVTVVKLRE